MLAIGGFFVWKGTSARDARPSAAHAPPPSDPSRRFNIYVKSEPPGADIFLDGKAKPVGATPISLPIDLNGVSSVQMVLKKPGFEDYQQIITTDSPISINLQPLEVPAGPRAASGVAPAAGRPPRPRRPPPRRRRQRVGVEEQAPRRRLRQALGRWPLARARSSIPSDRPADDSTVGSVRPDAAV